MQLWWFAQLLLMTLFESLIGEYLPALNSSITAAHMSSDKREIVQLQILSLISNSPVGFQAKAMISI
jgi:hypothetical protein